LRDRLARGRECKLFHAIGSACLFRIGEVRLRIPVGELDGLGADDARAEQTLPKRLFADATRRYDPVAGNGNSMTGSLHGERYFVLDEMRSKA